MSSLMDQITYNPEAEKKKQEEEEAEKKRLEEEAEKKRLEEEAEKKRLEEEAKAKEATSNTNKDEEESGPKVENDPPKKEDPPTEPPKPREPEKKIPIDFTEDIKALTELKQQGNDLIKSDFKAALEKYEEGLNKMKPLMEKASGQRDFNPQVKELTTLKKSFMSNLALCYMKDKQYQRALNLDIEIISIDNTFDKSYARLFTAYKELDQKDQAIYFGGILKSRFNQETLDKYPDLIKEVDALTEEVQKQIKEENAKRRAALIKKVATIAVPIVILIAAVGFYFYKKKSIAS